MRTTLDLPDPLFRELKAQAARDGLKLKELLAVYVEAGLRGRPPLLPGASRRRSPAPLARRPTGKTIPALTGAEVARLLDEEDGHARR